MQTSAFDAHRRCIRTFDNNAHTIKRGEGCKAIRACQEAGNMRRAIGKSAEHQRTM